MPWSSIKFDQDTDNPSIGTLSALYTDENGETFTFSRRTDVASSKDKTAFVKAALDSVSPWIEKREMAPDISTILSALNA